MSKPLTIEMLWSAYKRCAETGHKPSIYEEQKASMNKIEREIYDEMLFKGEICSDGIFSPKQYDEFLKRVKLKS